MQYLPLKFIASFLVVGTFFVFYPDVDIWVSSQFYDSADGFYLEEQVVIDFIYEYTPVYSWGLFLGLIAGLIVTSRKPLLIGLNRRAYTFLLITLLCGPGLLTMIFKDNWDRARPHDTALFGGDKEFSRAFVISDQCDRNCSFYSGHPTTYYFLIALAMLFEGRKRKALLTAGIIGGFTVGMIRVVQGGHFFSDIIISGFMVTATAYLMFWLFYRRLPFAEKPLPD